MKKNFVSNSTESTRMFKSNFLESLSKVPFYIPLVFYIPIIGYMIWRSFANENMTFLHFSMAFFSGLGVWTLVEYVLHRFVFHFHPQSAWGKRIHFIFHGVHHDYPNDAKRLVMPPSASLPLAALFFLLFRSLVSEYLLYASFAGFIFGYLIYDMMHYALHHYNFKSGLWLRMKKHHMLHHYSDETKGYGVSSAVWDKIFKTNFSKK